MSVDITGTAADLERLRDGLRSAATSGAAFEIDTDVDGHPAKLCINRSHDALAVLETEYRFMMAGDQTSLGELARCVDNVLVNSTNSQPIEGFHAHEEFWDGDIDRGPAGELTIYITDTYVGSSTCPPGCQPP